MDAIRSLFNVRHAVSLCGVILPTVFMANMAQADTISPSSYSATISVGGSTNVNTTVTVTKEASTQADIFFLADTTGSMSGAIGNVRAGAAGIMSATSGLGSTQWGVGAYKDVGDIYTYQLNQAMTSSTAAVQTGINSWSASGGGDTPEAELYALDRVATDAATGWRTGSRKLAVWFGDASGHDPSLGVTEASATASLVAKGISVLAVNVGALDSAGQATRITNATGGSYYSSISTDVTTDILAALSTAISNYLSVCLDTSNTPVGLSASASACITGTYDRSVDRSFDFSLSFTGAAPGTYIFDTFATVDGGRVAAERDSITVTEKIPEPSTLLLMGIAGLGLGFSRRRSALM